MKAPKEVLDDFRNHLYFCFKYLNLGEPTPKQYAIAEFLQHGDNDFILQAGRGDGKSVITACFVSWRLLVNPNRTQLVISATGDRAIKFVSQVRQILRLVPYMQFLEPGEFDKDSAFGFNVSSRTVINQDLSVAAKGITSQITGSHADDIICDDVEIPENSENTSSREKLWEKCLELENVKNKLPDATIRFLGTPQTKDSVYNKLAGLYRVIKYPAVMPDKTIETSLINISPYILGLEMDPGQSTQPERFSDGVMSDIQAKIGPTLFALHYKLDTSDADFSKYPLHLADLLIFDVDSQLFPTKITWANSVINKRVTSFGMSGDRLYEPMWWSSELLPYLETVVFIDPAGRGADETAVCIASFVNGYVVVHELFGLAGGYDTPTILKICKKINEYNAHKIRYESNFGDGMFGQILRPLVSQNCRQVAIEEYKVTGNKESRILSILEPVFSQHRLVLSTRAINDKETQIQITRLTAHKGSLAHDDRIDVLSATVAYWTKGLALDPDKEIQKNQKLAEQRNHMNFLSNNRVLHILGYNISGATKIEQQPVGPKKLGGWGYSILPTKKRTP